MYGFGFVDAVVDRVAALSELDYNWPRYRRRLVGMEPLLAWRSGARKKFQVKDAPKPVKRRASLDAYGAPPPAAALRAVLELKFLSRKIASKPFNDWDSPGEPTRASSQSRERSS